jgi:hypothetical protein
MGPPCPSFKLCSGAWSWKQDARESKEKSVEFGFQPSRRWQVRDFNLPKSLEAKNPFQV